MAGRVLIHTGTEHRVFLVSKFEEAVYVLHALEKKTQRTPAAALALAARRYRELVAERRAATRTVTKNVGRAGPRAEDR